jgi:hypothetical protein
MMMAGGNWAGAEETPGQAIGRMLPQALVRPNGSSACVVPPAQYAPTSPGVGRTVEIAEIERVQRTERQKGRPHTFLT